MNNAKRKFAELVKPIEYDVDELLLSYEVIQNNPRLSAELNKVYGTESDWVKASIKGNLIKAEAVAMIQRLAPICYKIGEKVFLFGETTKKEFDIIGDDMDYQPLYELYDMTTEMKTGDSYTFYVSSLSFFPLASKEEMNDVIEFLHKIK